MTGVRGLDVEGRGLVVNEKYFSRRLVKTKCYSGGLCIARRTASGYNAVMMFLGFVQRTRGHFNELTQLINITRVVTTKTPNQL